MQIRITGKTAASLVEAAGLSLAALKARGRIDLSDPGQNSTA